MQAMTRLMAVVFVIGVLASAAMAADAEDSATKARIAELEKKRADLYKKMPAYGGNRSAGREDAAARRAVYTEIQDLNSRITQLKLGPEDGAKYAEYSRKSKEIGEQYREIWADKDLDKEAKKTQLAECGKRRTALYKEYADIIKKAAAVTREAYSSRQRVTRLEALKKLLKPTEDEWKVLEPRLGEVVTLLDKQRRKAWATRTPAAHSPSYLWKRPGASSKGELAKVVQKDGATTADIQAKIDAVRKDRDENVKALADLEKKLAVARKALREILMVKQEAVLIVEAILD